MAANPSFKLDGLAEAQKALRSFGGTSADAKAMNKHVVDEVIVPPSKAGAPVRSGSLRASIGSDSTATNGIVTAGGQGGVRYAGVIHFGWSTRGLGAKARGKKINLTTDIREGAGPRERAAIIARRRRQQARSGNLQNMKSNLMSANIRSSGNTLTTRALNKAARSAKRGRVRGGPIRPNPFIYKAIDGRHGDVFEAYEKQLEHRAEIEGLL